MPRNWPSEDGRLIRVVSPYIISKRLIASIPPTEPQHCARVACARRGAQVFGAGGRLSRCAPPLRRAQVRLIAAHPSEIRVGVHRRRGYSAAVARESLLAGVDRRRHVSLLFGLLRGRHGASVPSRRHNAQRDCRVGRAFTPFVN